MKEVYDDQFLNVLLCAVIILTHLCDTSHMTRCVWRNYNPGLVWTSASHFGPKKMQYTLTVNMNASLMGL